MICCSHCNQDKTEDNYYRYYHSVRQKWYTRKVCRTCFASQQFQFFEKKREEKEQKIAEQIKAHEEQRRIDELIKAGKKLKRCIKCQIVRDANDYYNTRAVCKECVKEHERSYRRTREAKLKLERGVVIERFIKSKPGEYNNEYEQIATKELLTSIGWTFNEENNIFYKEGIKDKNGKWDNVKEVTPTISMRGDYREAAKNLTIDTIPRIKLKFRTHKSISEDLLNIVIREHIINNMKVSEIAKKYNVPYMSVHGWIDLLYDRLKEDKT